MKSLVLLVVVTIVAFIVSLAYRLGAFKDVKIELADAGPFKTVSKQHVGAYHKILPVIEEVEKWTRARGESCRLSFGEYIDNVDLVEEDRLRSNGGCVVEKEMATGLPEGFAYREFPNRKYVIAEFDGAPSIGPQKVYPKVEDYIEANKLEPDGSVIEMYEILPDQKVITRYYFPVKTKQG